MSKDLTIVECKFVQYGTSKTGNTYLRLSDGMETLFFNTSLSKEVFADLKKGDTITAGFIVDPFDSYHTSVESIVQA